MVLNYNALKGDGFVINRGLLTQQQSYILSKRIHRSPYGRIIMRNGPGSIIL
ncbi:MAG: hypothetical protein ACOC4M_11105 [Promethearchaeia archaeon]